MYNDNEMRAIKKMHQDQLKGTIEDLKNKLDTTKYNVEISKEIISETPSDTEREKLIEKNIRRKSGIANLEGEILDLESRH